MRCRVLVIQAAVRTTRTQLSHNPNPATPGQPARFTATSPSISPETPPINTPLPNSAHV
jgi:hypothetical protein